MSESPASPQVDPLILERIEFAFPALVGDFRVLERELSFDGRPVADLLGYSRGQLLLIRVFGGEGEDAVLAALDGLVFAETQSEILDSFLPPDTPEEISTRVVLVSLSGFSTLQMERLSVLQGDGLWLLRKRELRTKKGTHTRLEPIDVGDGRSRSQSVDLPAWAISEPHRSFLALIAPDRLSLAISLVERVRRIDSDCSWGFEAENLICEFEGERLCSISWFDGHLEVFHGEDRSAVPIRDAAAIDLAVDVVLADYLALLNGGNSAKEPSIRVIPAADAFDEAIDLDDLDDEILDQVELRPTSPEPLLTRAEIEAFQE
ncbi:MAG: hypothetical protein ACI8X5_001591 [Planctomycetota bacterium]|jgi:hypothetical protein